MGSDGSDGRGPLYDAFVVRLWRDAGTGSVLRAEVEHARTGTFARAAAVPTGWILGQIRARLAAGPPIDATLSDGVETTPGPPTRPPTPLATEVDPH